MDLISCRNSFEKMHIDENISIQWSITSDTFKKISYREPIAFFTLTQKCKTWKSKRVHLKRNAEYDITRVGVDVR